MHFNFKLALALAFLLVLNVLAGCASQSTVKPFASGKATVDARQKVVAIPANFAAAKRFISSSGSGELMRLAFDRKLKQMATDQPGMAELVRRVFDDFTVEELEDVAAQVYARNLELNHLESLNQFTETPAGSRFFRRIFAAVADGKVVDDSLMREFNADELTVISKFGLSESSDVLRMALPTINRELAEEARKLGEEKMREYLRRQ